MLCLRRRQRAAGLVESAKPGNGPGAADGSAAGSRRTISILHKRKTGVTDKTICHPSKSRLGWRRKRLFHLRSSTNCRWPKVRRGSWDFLQRVYLVSRLLVKILRSLAFARSFARAYIGYRAKKQRISFFKAQFVYILKFM